jgi:glutaconyl-CoA/methylmalonyl-CoA decarboxylase subunit gamma
MKKYEYLINGKPFVVEILSFDGRRAAVRVNNIDYSVEIPQAPVTGVAAYPAPSPAAPPPVPAQPPRAPVPSSPARAEARPPAPTAAARPAAPPPRAQVSSDKMVTAPMPGIILSILVKEGDAVNAGDALLVLEAMKMENEIHAPLSGTIRKIHVREGAEVRAGSELIEFE